MSFRLAYIKLGQKLLNIYSLLLYLWSSWHYKRIISIKFTNFIFYVLHESDVMARVAQSSGNAKCRLSESLSTTIWKFFSENCLYFRLVTRACKLFLVCRITTTFQFSFQLWLPKSEYVFWSVTLWSNNIYLTEKKSRQFK